MMQWKWYVQMKSLYSIACERVCICRKRSVIDDTYIPLSNLPLFPLPRTLFQMEGVDGDSDDEAVSEAVSSGKLTSSKSMRRLSVGNTLLSSRLSTVEDEEQQYEESMAEIEHLKELEALAEPDPEEVGVCADEEDLGTIFNFYKKQNDEGGEDFINVMNFCTIWRMVTGEKGNLMREMQVFNHFDLQKDGYLEKDNFIMGFLNHSVDNTTNKLLIKLHAVVEGGSVMF